MQIIPMHAIKDTADIERRCSEENSLRKVYEANMIIEGIEDVNEGRISDGKAVIDNIRSRYGL